MKKTELLSHIDSIPRINLQQAKNAIFRFSGGTGRLESYIPGYGKLKILLSKEGESLIISLSECHDFLGATEFTISHVAIELLDSNLKTLNFGAGDFKASFESLVFLEEKQ